MPYCVVKKCKNTSANLKNNTGLSFHKFPREPILRNKWIDALRKNREENSWSPSTYCVICSAHFQESELYVTKTGLRRLNKNAVPTKNLCDPAEICTVISSNNLDSYSSLHPSPSTSSKSFSTQLMSTGTGAISLSANNPSPNLTDFDNDSIFDTSREVRLKKELKKHQILRVKTKRKLKCLQQKLRRLKKKNASLESILKDLESKNLVNLDIHKKKTENLVSTELFHILYMHWKGKKKRKLSPAIKKFCLTLDSYSPKAYEYLRKSFNTCLPPRKTLTKWFTHLNEEPRFTGESLSALRETVTHSSDNHNLTI